jgi:hypothetical protein
MSESQQETGPTPNASSQAAWFCNWLREGAERAIETVVPPEGAAKHFREARLEILRGIRELIDYRIERLSKTNKGGRIAVE